MGVSKAKVAGICNEIFKCNKDFTFDPPDTSLRIQNNINFVYCFPDYILSF